MQQIHKEYLHRSRSRSFDLERIFAQKGAWVALTAVLMSASFFAGVLPVFAADEAQLPVKKTSKQVKKTPKKQDSKGAKSADAKPAVFVASDGTASWSDTVKHQLSGLRFEEPNAEFSKKASEFVAFKTDRMNKKKRTAWASSCVHDAARTDASVFCDFLNDARGEFLTDARAPASHDSSASSENPSPTLHGEDDDAAGSVRSDLPVSRVSQLLVEAKIEELGRVSEKTLYRALRVFPDWKQLELVSERILSHPGCKNPALFSAFGMKAEEFFPHDQFRKLATDFYSRAALCDDEGDATTKARYRLGLLHVWAGQCSQAEPVLLRVSEGKANDFTVRSLYWRATCAKSMGNKLLYSAIRGRLLKDYPLTYHGLLLGGESSESMLHVAQILDNQPPRILFRSKLRPELNRAVRAAEKMLELKQFSIAASLLRPLEKRMKTAEREFQFYVGLLTGRTGEKVSQFRILSSVFRENPSTLSRESLMSFYPLHRFDELKVHDKKIDPFLISALIRQESGFNEQARSPAGALGLMQIMPATARRMERVNQRQLLDPKTNIRLGIRFFGSLLERFNGDAELALAAYNAGPAKVDQWKRRYTMQDRMLFLDLIPYKETRDYVSFIARNYYWYLQLYRSSTPQLRQGATPTVGEADRRPAFSLFKSS